MSRKSIRTGDRPGELGPRASLLRYVHQPPKVTLNPVQRDRYGLRHRGVDRRLSDNAAGGSFYAPGAIPGHWPQ
jgi:hypothetical protein